MPENLSNLRWHEHHMSRTKHMLACIWMIFLMPVSANAEDTGHAARALAMQMLDVMGGAEAWKQVRTVHSLAVNHHPDARLPYIQEYWFDTRAPKHFIKLTNHDLKRARGYDVNGGWSVMEGTTRAFDENRLKREINSWSRSPYRKFYLLAADPANLHIEFGTNDRLEFFHRKEFIGWMKVNAKGEPVRHGGTESSADYTEFDKPERFGSIFWPGSGRDGQGWRFELLSVEVSNQEMPVSPSSLSEDPAQP